MKAFTTLLFLFLFCISLQCQNIGIGTNNPRGKLEIGLNSSSTNPHLLLYEDGNDYSRIQFVNNNGNNFWEIGGYISSNAENNVLKFENGDAGTLLALKGNGRLGLAVDVFPKTTFHVGDGESVLFGSDIIGNGDKLMFLPDLHAFRVGTITASYSTYWDRDSIGLFSFASGLNTRAQGSIATAIGVETQATNTGAFATGYKSNASGEYSTAMGYTSIASGLNATALGHISNAEGDYSFATGKLAEALAKSSIAIGSNTLAQSFKSTALGSFNIGGGNATTWIEDDPILEIGIGQNEGTRSNALTVLKNGRHGIMTSAPKANLHIKDDGLSGIPTIVAVLESDLSDRPVLQFSETSVGDAGSGMSIEYDGSGSGSENKLYFNKTDGLPAVTIENGGQVGIGVTSPSFALHLPDNSVTGKARAHSWTTYSDERIKSNKHSLSYGLREIMLLKPLSYKQHPASFENSELQVSSESENTIGFFAQEVHDIIPEAVSKPDDENEQLWGMEYEKLIPVLVKAIQEQQHEIELLKTKLDTQEAKYLSVQNYSEASLKKEK